MFVIVTFLMLFAGLGLAFIYAVCFRSTKLSSSKKCCPVIGICYCLKLFKRNVSLLERFKILVGIVCVGLFMILAVTAFVPTIFFGHHMSGWLMMIHATLSGPFAVVLAVTGVFFARDHYLSSSFIREKRDSVPDSSSRDTEEASLDPAQRIIFWGILILSLPLIISMLVSMLPVFGTDAQHILMNIHRYTASAFAVWAMLYFLFAMFNANK